MRAPCPRQTPACLRAIGAARAVRAQGLRGWLGLPGLLHRHGHRSAWWLAALVASAAALLTASPVPAAPRAAPAPAAAAIERWHGWAEQAFQHIGLAEGLPNDVTVDVAEDGAGYIWVGTLGGMARWDGYRFRVHRFEPGRSGGMPDNLVQVMHRDPKGRLWIGTSAAGLVRYEPVGERFTTIGAGPQGLSHVSVRALTDDGAGGLWVGSDAGLDHVDGDSGRVRRVRLGAEGDAGLLGDRVVALLHDRQGRLWAGTPMGLFRRDAGTQRFVAVPLPPDPRRRDPAVPQPESLMQDSAGRLWVGSSRHGAFVLPADGGPARAVQESRVHGSTPVLPTSRVLALLEARPGEVWIGTLGKGLVVVDAASGRTRRLKHRPTLPASLLDNNVRGLFRDGAGLVWVATHGGVSRLDPRADTVLTVTTTRPGTPAQARSDHSALMASADGRVWMGTLNDGIQILDPRDGSLQALRPNPANPAGALQSDVVVGLAQAEDGSVYTGTYRGLYRASADGRRVARVALPGRPADGGVGPLLREGPLLWVGSLTDGLWQLDTRNGRATRALADGEKQFSDRRITALARGPDGALWVGTRNGLNRWQPGASTVQRIGVGAPGSRSRPGALAAGFVTHLLLDSRARLWVATYGGGLHLLQADGSAGPPRFLRIGSEDGLPDDNINALAEDASGRLWVSTDSGLAMVDPQTLKARGLRRADGVVFASYWTGSVARTAAGEILFGASGGLSVVRPALLQPWQHRPRAVLTEVQIGGRIQPPGAALQVPADGRDLRLEFAALDYSAPERNRYAHRLLGHETEWVYTDAQHRAAAYGRLAPGRYEFQLRGSNREGLFNDDMLRVPVEVLAAWHETAWFRAAAALGLLLALYGVVQARTRVLRRRREELQRLVDERTAELQAVSRALTEKSRALEEKSRVLERASIIDPLTGLHNRRFLAEHIEATLAASLRRAGELAQRPAGPAGTPAQALAQTPAAATPIDTDTIFFLIDADHFKRVNDDLGHAAGDTVLVQLAQRLQAAMRESDFVVRWGGEEFLAVARETDRARADELAERIRASVCETPFRLNDGRQLTVSCSVGHACWPFLPQHPQALDWLGVVNLADLGLLTAKRLGRNAWVGLHGTPQAQPEGLLARAQAAPRQAWHSGEIGVTSSHARASDIEAALQAS